MAVPPVGFRQVGVPGCQLTWIHASLSGSNGVQLDLRFKIVHHVPMTLSIGSEQACPGADKLDDERVLSLKLP
jgi:hypothetical protein